MVDSHYTLSPSQARKIVLLSQGIHRQNQLGQGTSALLKVIEQLGYVQIDTISVVERAHHHTLWNRVNGYSPEHLSELQQKNRVFEYWSHAAAYLPMRDYRYSLPRKQAIASGEMHWFESDVRLNKQILKRIRQEGPLQSKDFEHHREKGANEWWQWKPAKIALEQLFMEGELMITGRKGFQKIYDLTERVLPGNIDTTTPSLAEYQRHLINRFLRANGIGTVAEISYLRKGMKKSIAKQCEHMLEHGQLIKVKVGSQNYYALPQVEKLLCSSLSRCKVKILSPFDNLLIQRKRMLELFNFNYQIECYVPAAKRRYGYFCLPLLWGQSFAGRMDAKIERKTGVLSILNLHLETPKTEKFLTALKPSLMEFLAFNQGRKIVLQRVTNNTANDSPAMLRQLRQQFH